MPLPTPDIEGIKKFADYRKKGLSYRDIEKLTGKSLKTLTRWNKYIIGGVLEGKSNTASSYIAGSYKNKSKSQIKSAKNYRMKNVLKIIARKVVFVGKRNGSIKPLPCEVCGSFPTEAHHPDYTKAKEIVWLCRQHHHMAEIDLSTGKSLTVDK